MNDYMYTLHIGRKLVMSYTSTPSHWHWKVKNEAGVPVGSFGFCPPSDGVAVMLFATQKRAKLALESWRDFNRDMKVKVYLRKRRAVR